MGTPEFAVPTLAKLYEKYGLEAVVTVPDKPQGRKRKLKPSDVKIKAEELGIPVLQPKKLKDENFIKSLKEIQPDIIAVLAFRILPEEVFSIAEIATFNIHASLLPKYRGAAPINWAIVNGEKLTGLTSFIIEKKVDTGNIISQKKINIPEGANAGDLHDILSPLAAELAVETCEKLISGDYALKMQDEAEATPAPKIYPEDCKIDWNKDSREVANFIKGMSPFPGAWSLWNGDKIKFTRAAPVNKNFGDPGEFLIENKSLLVQCASGTVSIKELQPAGKKLMKIQDFLNGYRGESRGKLE